ncbi:hypothetical protein H1R20_g10527, partial [Candolleomyces eurysporus]
MASDNTSGEVSTTATQERPQPVYWDHIFFKVEEITFSVPPHRLIENSEVFAAMFDLPTGEDGRLEGRNKQHPIVLEDYQASDFNALLRILYPTPRDLISGAFKLEKDEWIGVLNLSTRWQMKEIRDHAINNLSKISLSPIEKVVLARAHKVAKWLKEGLTEIVTEDPIRPLEDLERLGLKTACRLLWIRDQTVPHKAAPVQGFNVTLGSLACPSGHVMFPAARNCSGCSRSISVDDPEAIYLYNSSSVQIQDSGTPGPTRTSLIINLQILRCRAMTTGSHQNPGPRSDVNVSDVFKEEIASYESWDQ